MLDWLIKKIGEAFRPEPQKPDKSRQPITQAPHLASSPTPAPLPSAQNTPARAPARATVHRVNLGGGGVVAHPVNATPHKIDIPVAPNSHESVAVVRLSDGRTLSLGKKIAQGGEGTVYEIVGYTSKLAKVWHKPPSDLPRLMRLIEGYPELKVRPELAWPEEAIHDPKSGAPVGFIMKRVSGEEAEMIHPANFADCFPGKDRLHLVQAARNLAALVANIHARGIVIGDLQPLNIKIHPQSAEVALLDCDSFQPEGFTTNGHRPEYTAPEFLEKTVPRRDENADRFALSVNIFRILHLGYHPYQTKENVPIEKMNSNASFPFMPGKWNLLPKDRASKNIWFTHSEETKQAFRKTFGRGRCYASARHSAREWAQTLNRHSEQILSGKITRELIPQNPPPSF